MSDTNRPSETKRITTVYAGGRRAFVTRERSAFVVELLNLRHRAGALKLYATMQELDKAVKRVGWEMAGNPEQATAIKPKRRRA